MTASKVVATFSRTTTPYYTVEGQSKQGWANLGVTYLDEAEAVQKAKAELIAGFYREVRVVGWNLPEDIPSETS